MQGFWRLFGKGRMFGRPFFKTNPQELSTLRIYPENSWTTQRMRQSKNTIYHKFCPVFLSYNLGGTSHERPWPWSWKKKHVWNPAMDTWCMITLDLGWDDIKRHLLEQLQKPIHANKNKNNLLLKTYPAIYPVNSWKATKNVSIKNMLSISTVAHDFYPAT